VGITGWRAERSEGEASPVHAVLAVLRLNACEPLTLNGDFFHFNFSGFHAQAKFFQFIQELLAIHQINRWCTISRGFSYDIFCESPRCDKQTFVCAAYHRATKIPNLPGTDCALPFFTLKDDMETEQATQSQ
jgi:hypothetical protein